MKVNILGTEYDIKVRSSKDDPKLENNWGYNDETTKEIVLDNLELDKDTEDLNKLDEFSLKVLRHEIIHCFFNESGLGECCEFARDEVLVDWIARQLPKITKACSEAEEQFRESKIQRAEPIDKSVENPNILDRLHVIRDLVEEGLISKEKKLKLCDIQIAELKDGVYNNVLSNETIEAELEQTYKMKNKVLGEN